MKKIKILAVIGKAGSGKNTILQSFITDKQNDYYYIMDDNGKHHKHFNTIFEDNYNIIVPFTTRPMRPGEVNGKDYHFFEEGMVAPLIENGEIAQCIYFRDWLYGFAWDEFKEDRINIGIFNPAAVIDLSDYDNLDITTVYINAPDKDRLLRQLNREDNPDVKEIVRRFGTDDYDFREEILAQMPDLHIIDNPNQELEYKEDFNLYPLINKLDNIIMQGKND